MPGVFQNFDPSPPSPPSECVALRTKGGGYTLAGRWRGWGVNILEDASHRIGLLQSNLSTLCMVSSASRRGTSCGARSTVCNVFCVVCRVSSASRRGTSCVARSMTRAAWPSSASSWRSAAYPTWTLSASGGRGESFSSAVQSQVHQCWGGSGNVFVRIRILLFSWFRILHDYSFLIFSTYIFPLCSRLVSVLDCILWRDISFLCKRFSIKKNYIF